jgi:hypothetical protein
MGITVGAAAITFNDGTTQTTAATTAVGAGSELFTSSGTFTVPPRITSIKVTVVGGGGGGGGGSLDITGGAGGFGGFSAGSLTVTPGESYTVTVGAGGAGSNSGNGSAGSASSFGTAFTTTGGGGGELASGNNGANGANGTGSGATINLMIARPDTVYRARAASSTAAVAFAIGTALYPGAGGLGESSISSNAVGGVGGAVLVEW